MISAPATFRPREARRPSLSVTEASFDRRHSVDFRTGIPIGGPKLTVQPTWNPKEAASNDQNRAQAKNVIDGK